VITDTILLGHFHIRPEYIEAVNSVKFGVGLYLTILLPALLIIGAFLVNRFFVTNVGTAQRTLALFTVTMAAAIVSLFMCFVHFSRIQSAKQVAMVTDAEIADFADDTWSTFGMLPVGGIILVYCGLLFMAGLTGTAITRLTLFGKGNVEINAAAPKARL